MYKKRILILGAGLAGLSAAWHLERKGINCRIFEKEPEAGGLCRSKKTKGFTFDYDGHLLHFRHKYTHDFVRDLIGIKLVKYRRNSFVRYLGCEIPYPFQANFLKLPVRVAQECLAGLREAESKSETVCQDFKSWIYASFGNGIAKHFMIPYNEKFWTVPLSGISCEWLNGFIPMLKADEIINNSLIDSEPVGYNAYFYYPAKGGIGSLASAIAGHLGGSMCLGSAVTNIDLINKTVTINNKEEFFYDSIISTIPLPEFRNIIKDIPFDVKQVIDSLDYNSISVFNLGIKGSLPDDKHWVYFPEKKDKFFRIGFYSSFSPDSAPLGHSSIYAEVSRPKNSDFNVLDLKNSVFESLVREKIVADVSDIIHCSVIDIKYGYPVYGLNHKGDVGCILDFLSDHGVMSIGRYGKWQYMTMEDALLEGRHAAGNIK